MSQTSVKAIKVEQVEVACDVAGLALGLVVARGCVPALVDDAVARAVQMRTPDDVRSAVRNMLRHGKYKPTGRGKPASEYLMQAAAEGQFPRVFPLVDWCNVASLESGIPISLIDLARAGTTQFRVRRGRAGESYVFNAGGQSIDLEDLLLVSRGTQDEPCANAVRDSMATKLTAQAVDVLAVIYAPRALEARVRAAKKTLMAAYGPHSAGEVLLG